MWGSTFADLAKKAQELQEQASEAAQSLSVGIRVEGCRLVTDPLVEKYSLTFFLIFYLFSRYRRLRRRPQVVSSISMRFVKRKSRKVPRSRNLLTMRDQQYHRRRRPGKTEAQVCRLIDSLSARGKLHRRHQLVVLWGS